MEVDYSSAVEAALPAAKEIAKSVRPSHLILHMFWYPLCFSSTHKHLQPILSLRLLRESKTCLKRPDDEDFAAVVLRQRSLRAALPLAPISVKNMC